MYYFHTPWLVSLHHIIFGCSVMFNYDKHSGFLSCVGVWSVWRPRLSGIVVQRVWTQIWQPPGSYRLPNLSEPHQTTDCLCCRLLEHLRSSTLTPVPFPFLSGLRINRVWVTWTTESCCGSHSGSRTKERQTSSQWGPDTSGNGTAVISELTLH